MSKCKIHGILTLGLTLFANCQSQHRETPESQYFAASESQHFAVSVCDETTAQLVARAYVLSIPLLFKENDLIPLMEQYKSYFEEDGKVIQCMRSLGENLVQNAIENYHPENGTTATEMFGGSMPEGLEDLPGQVDASMRSFNTDLYAMGAELIWLSQVLPPAAYGDYQPYNTTGTISRQSMREVMNIYQLLCQMDPGVCQMMKNIMQQMQPEMEQQISSLALQLNN